MGLLNIQQFVQDSPYIRFTGFASILNGIPISRLAPPLHHLGCSFR